MVIYCFLGSPIALTVQLRPCKRLGSVTMKQGKTPQVSVMLMFRFLNLELIPNGEAWSLPLLLRPHGCLSLNRLLALG